MEKIYDWSLTAEIVFNQVTKDLTVTIEQLVSNNGHFLMGNSGDHTDHSQLQRQCVATEHNDRDAPLT